MTSVGSYEAKTHLPSLLDRVANGEKITITKHGVPVAMIVPMPYADVQDPKEVIAQILAFRRGRKLEELSIRDMIEEGRKY